MKLVYDMSIQGNGRDPVVVLRLSGCVDSETAPAFGEVMDILLGRNDCPLIVDMTSVSYISSAGWREFVTKTQNVLDGHVQIQIAGMQPTVRDVFELIGLNQVYPSHACVRDAIESLATSHKG